MKKLFLLILPVMAIALCIGSPASAQEGKMAIGGLWGLGSGPSFGLGAKFQYGVSDPVRLEASITQMWGAKENYGFTTYATNVFDFGVHVHYLFPKSYVSKNNTKAKINLYPLAGLGVYKATAKVSQSNISIQASETKVGLDIGGGAELFSPNDKFSVFSEMKVGLGSELSRFSWLSGIMYHF